MSGWIKLHRKLTEWEWYSDVNTTRVFLHLLLVANHKDNQWRGILVKRGQRLTSISKLADETNLSVKNIRTAIKRLKSTSEVASHSTAQHTVFTVINYDLYQGMASEVANEGQADGKQGATNNKVNNVNNENKNDLQPEKETSGKVKSKHKFSDNDMKLVNWMIPLIKKVSPTFKCKNPESWANTIRLMNESDKLDHKHIAEVFKWANQDSFWKTNIMSPSKLREKFAALDAKRLSNGVSQITAKRSDFSQNDYSNNKM